MNRIDAAADRTKVPANPVDGPSRPRRHGWVIRAPALLSSVELANRIERAP